MGPGHVNVTREAGVGNWPQFSLDKTSIAWQTDRRLRPTIDDCGSIRHSQCCWLGVYDTITPHDKLFCDKSPLKQNPNSTTISSQRTFSTWKTGQFSIISFLLICFSPHILYEIDVDVAPVEAYYSTQLALIRTKYAPSAKIVDKNSTCSII